VPPDAAAIADVIRRFTVARSSRGVWQAERELADNLGGRSIDVLAAAAARRLGEWLRSRAGRAA
jgi:hypothetical protein